MRSKALALTMTTTMIMVSLMNLVPLETDALEYGEDTPITGTDASYFEEGFDTGYAVDVIGDINGDGFDDFAFISVTYGGNTDNEVFFIFGKEGPWTPDNPESNASASFILDDYPGGEEALTGIGDMDGDGYDDFAIGVWQTVTDEYVTYIIYGRSDGWSRDVNINETADVVLHYPGEWQNPGWVVAGGGDINGDGLADLIVDDSYYWYKVMNAGRVFLVWGNETRLSGRVNISKVSTKIHGDREDMRLGYRMDMAGDVNGDGYDDFLLSTKSEEDDGRLEDIFLVYGRETWPDEMWLHDAAGASFLEPEEDSRNGGAVAGIGDVNGDGYDDFAIGAEEFWPHHYGLAMLYFGGEDKGWGFNTSWMGADVKMYGTSEFGHFGWDVEGLGDVNGDGYDDLAISAREDLRHYSSGGRVELFLGRPTDEWVFSVPVAYVASSYYLNASFDGTHDFHHVGESLGGGGDLNGDGLDDLIIDTDYPWGDGSNTWVVFPDSNQLPLSVSSIDLYKDEELTEEIDCAFHGDTVHVKMQATDPSPGSKSNALVNVTSNESYPLGIRLRLYETRPSSGTFVGSFEIGDGSFEEKHRIGAAEGETITVSPFRNPTVTSSLTAGRITLRPSDDQPTVKEDENYDVSYHVDYAPDVEWEVDTDAPWLTWDPAEHHLYGTPDNGDVGQYWMKIEVIDNTWNRTDRHNFTLEVLNVIPEILTNNTVTAIEDRPYRVEYNSSDDGQGTVTWSLETDADWLCMNESTGVLHGTPENYDVGLHLVEVDVDDGNGGVNSSEFEIEVLDVNDDPVITTEDVRDAIQDSPYRVDYEAEDADTSQHELNWSLESSSSWLSMDNRTGVLEGTPGPYDVGEFWVNVSVSDGEGGNGWTNFTLRVENVNDGPVFVDPTGDVEIDEGDQLQILVNATDPDGDEVAYSVSTDPGTDMSMDPDTGEIYWRALTSPEMEAPYVFVVTVVASDGELSNEHVFEVTVKGGPPTVELVGPENGAVIDRDLNFELEWEGKDPLNRSLTYDVFLSSDPFKVTSHDPEVRIAEDIDRTSISPSLIVLGETYYWTVLPNNGLITGSCEQEVFDYSVSIHAGNDAPYIENIFSERAYVDDLYETDIQGKDPDPWDGENLTYSLVDAPKGMEIEAQTGRISWRPGNDQVGHHEVTVEVSDGEMQGQRTFPIIVEEKDAGEEGVGLGLVVVLLIVAILVSVALTWLVASRRGGGGGMSERVEVPSTEGEGADTGSRSGVPPDPERPTTEEAGQAEGDGGMEEDGEKKTSTEAGEPGSGVEGPVEGDVGSRGEIDESGSEGDVIDEPADPSGPEEEMGSPEGSVDDDMDNQLD